MAGVIWFYVSVLNYSPYDSQEVYRLDEVHLPKRSENDLVQVGPGISAFGESIWGRGYEGEWQHEVYM